MSDSTMRDQRMDAIDELNKIVRQFADVPPFAEVFEHAQRLPAQVSRLLAAQLIYEHITDRARRLTRETERRSLTWPDGHRAPRKGTKARAAWEQQTDMGQQLAEVDQRSRDQLLRSIEAITEEYKRQVRVEWTADLLAAVIAMPDGSRTTWGDATIEQHEIRLATFNDNAAANIQGAARHSQAIEDLSASGKRTLNELVEEADERQRRS